MTTPRKHTDLATRYCADDTLKCWVRTEGSNNDWVPLIAPTFTGCGIEYYIGHEPPLPDNKRTITLTVNGREWVLPEPLRDTPRHSQLVFYISDDGTVRSCRWNNWAVLPTLHEEQRLHDTEADAQAWADFDKWCRGGGV